MIVRVLSIKPACSSTDDRYAATYDVCAEIDARAYTFGVGVELVTVGDHTIQCANFIDGASQELFRWHQLIPPKLSKLVFAVYNNEPVALPVDLDESWPATPAAVSTHEQSMTA